MLGTWRDIPGFPGYQANSDGLVKSRRKVLKSIPHRGYYVVKLGHPNKAYGIHQCVMAAFNGWPDDGLVVNHKNGIKTDNRLVNLEYTTNIGNVLHAYENDMMRNKGEQNGRATITANQAAMIARADRTIPATKVAESFGCSKTIVRQIRSGKTWKSPQLQEV